MVLNKRRDVENGIRALLREAGLKVGTPSRRNFAARVIELVTDDPVLTALTMSLLSVIAVMTQEIDRLTKRVLDEVRIEPTCRRLMTVQGVGPFTALAFRATIDRPGSLPQIARRRRPSRLDAQTLPIRRDRRAGPYQPVRR
jgi:transposase